MIRAAAAALAAAAVVAGCGGEPSARDWARSADAACRRGAKAIKDRGTPADLPGLRRFAELAAADVHAEAAALERAPTPERMRSRSRAVRQALARVERRFRQLSEARAAADLRAKLDPLDAEWEEVDWQGQKAGLEACADHRLWAFADDWGTPVFAREYERYLRGLDARFDALEPAPVSGGRRVAAHYFVGLRELANQLEADVGSFNAPYAVLDQAQAYQDALYNLTNVADRMSRLARGMPATQLFHHAAAQRMRRAFAREYRTRVALADALRALRLNAPAPDSRQSS